MLKMRLQRFGRKNDPSFRVVVLEATEGPKSGNHVDQIGSYNAITKQKTLNKERASYWLSKGVQPSDTVYNFLVTEGVIQGKKKNVLPSKKPIVKTEEPKSEEASQASVASPETSTPEVTAVEETPASVEEVAVVEETPAEPVSEAQEATEADSPSTEPAA